MLTVSDEPMVTRMSQSGAMLALLLWLCSGIAVADHTPASEAATSADALFAGAEERLQPPSESWFDQTQQALKTEVARVGGELDSHRAADAAYWKAHLRWDLLERNLGPRATVNLSELETVRRWMYSNRKGLESPFFAPLRKSMDAYLDAALTFSYPDFRAEFNDKVALARRQCQALAEDPSDANAAALGQTLGWFEQTGQLASEVAAVRALTSFPNAQVVVRGELIRRIVATQASTISETIPVTEQVEIPPPSAWQRTRTMRVRGTATTEGEIQIVPTPNDKVAELSLVYQGTVHSTARGETGPVTVRIAAQGTAHAVKPVYFGPRGLELGKTAVTPHVTSQVTDVSADNEVIQLIARRRADQAASRTLTNSQARETTVEQLSARLDQRVEEALAKIRGEVGRVQSTLSQFGELTAPLAREGVALYFDSARSTASEIELNSFSRRRQQHGAAAPCPIESIAGDVLVRIHASFFNNMAETITGGKTLSDEFVMKYAKVVHAELPLPLMVHTRAPRWAMTMAKIRPIELQIPEANRIVFVVRVDSVEIDGVIAAAPTKASIAYFLTLDEFGEYRLERDGGVQLESALPESTSAFLREKLNAFFGPVLSGGGIVVPEGGVLGALRGLRSKGVHADHGWLVAGWDVPPQVVDELIKSQQPRDEPAMNASRNPLASVRQ
jgi:hypothetical protein